jgi:lysophospholipase L1-like esterase
MAGKISLSKLVEKIETAEITRSDYRKYFKIVSPNKRTGRMTVQINPQAVSTTASALSTVGVDALAHDAMNSVLASEAGSASLAPQVLAEGDSWFDLPFLYSSTIVDALKRYHFPVEEIAHPGDTIDNMISTGGYLKELKAKRYKVFMFSGGGNDVLGDLKRHLGQRVSGDNDIANSPRYIRDSFNNTLDHLVALYKEMIEETAATSPKTRIFIHGYAYAIPQINGYWLGNAFEERGFHPADDAKMCERITRAMVDAFNLRLEAIAAANKKRVTYIDLRNDVKKNEWWDELHPRPAAARRIAAKFAQEIQRYL